MARAHAEPGPGATTGGSTTAAPPRGGATTQIPAPAIAASATTPTGTAIACVDIRSGAPFSYYAQLLLASGALDAAWAPDANRLCMGTEDGLHQILSPDGSGGVYAGWVDARSGDGDIYLQHFTAQGVIASGWPDAGLPVCTLPHSQYNLDLASDGSGGVYMAWQDFRSGVTSGVYLQRIGASGVPAPGWAANGLAVCSQPSVQSGPHVVADGTGGALVVWQDDRAGHLDLYAQRLTESGACAPGWPAEGAPVASAGGDKLPGVLMADSSGNATVVWRQSAAGGATDLLALHISAQGIPAPGWPGSPVTLATGAEELGDPGSRLQADGGALVSWSEWRGGTASLHVAHLTGAGVVDPAWPAGGAVVAGAVPGRSVPVLLAEPDGGGIVAWEDFRDSTSDIYAQRLGAAGGIAAGWPAGGVAIATGAGEQYAPSMVPDGAGGALATWADGANSQQASLLAAHRVPGMLAAEVREAQARPGHAHIVWMLGPDSSPPPGVQVSRQVGTLGVPETIPCAAPDDSGRVVMDDRAAPEGAAVSYRLVLVRADYEEQMSPVTLRIPAAPLHLALSRVRALPGENLIAMTLALPRGAPPVVDLMDVMGRRMSRKVLEGLEPGEQAVRVEVPHHMASGVYFLRLVQGAETRNAKVVFVR